LSNSSSPVALPRAPRFASLPPLALYVHIPWCVRKCPYCDFNSHEARGALPEARYVEALVADLEQALPQVWGRRIYSIFFGGGTPSLFSANAIETILSAVRARLTLAADAEITLEANPGTVEAGKFAAYRAAGVNRLSIGIQSFNARHLRALGRIHHDAEARRAIEIARAHFENFNLDLMYALPEQTLDEVRADIATALEYEPPHLSVYHLTIEPNTYFHRYPPRVPDDDVSAAMQGAIESLLEQQGYDNYETSAFARTRDVARPQAFQCRHNLNYWMFGDYLGIGAGAHSKLTFADRIVREMRYKQPAQYMDQALRGTAIRAHDAVEARDIAFEFMMNALRLRGGFAPGLFTERSGLPLNTVMRELNEAERRGLLSRDHQRIAPTALGRRFLNDLLQIFLRDAPASTRPLQK
jgi:putative oxygen-independent coproporphyrinogen III oxidase